MRKLFTLVLALAACGDDGVHHLADAPPTADGMPDAALQAVTLTITKADAPEVGIKVYFQAPDSTEISSTMTDANGVAAAMMPNGGFVTAVDPFPPQTPPPPPFGGGPSETHQLRTFANVKPGDHLVLTVPDSVSATATVSVADDTGGAPSAYHVYASCGANYQYIPPNLGVALAPPTGTMTFYGCTTSDFLVIDADATGVPINYYVVPNVAIADGGTIDLTGGTYAGVTPTTFNVTGVPAAYSTVYDHLSYATSGGRFETDAYDLVSSPIGLTAGDGSIAIGNPTIPGSTRIEQLVLQSNNGYHELYRWGATPAGDGSFTFPVAGLQLLDFANYPSFDRPTSAIAWTTKPGVTPDFYVAVFVINRNITIGSGATMYANYEWEIAGAFSGPSIKPPTLPADAAVFNAIVDDNVFVDDVTLGKSPGGYDAVRARALDLYDNGSPRALATGTSGHFESVSAMQNTVARPAHSKHH